MEISIFNASNGKIEPGFRPILFADHIIWTETNDMIVSDCDLIRFDLETRTKINVYRSGYCNSEFAVSPDGEMLLWQTPKSDLEIRHLPTNTILAQIDISESNGATNYAWSSRGYIAFYDYRGYTELWDVNNLPDVSQLATVTPIPTETR